MATKKVSKKAAAKKKVVKATKGASPASTCFTIMPFGGWFNDYYETIYKPAIESAGLSACRADDLFRPSTIVHDIWEYTQNATLILADLSGKNPNVFYELGLAHALAKPAILITESIDDVPFDLRALRVLEYDKNEPRWGESLQERITNSIQEIVAAPLQAVLPAFLTVNQSSKPKSVSENEKYLLEFRREIDLLRNEVAHLRTNRRGMGSLQARERIADYVARGMPKDLILRRMRDFGVPAGWASSQIDRLSAATGNDSESKGSDPE